MKPIYVTSGLLKFLNNIYTENCIPNKWRNANVITVFKKGDRITEVSIFLIPAIRYILKYLI
jgi:hypothetical protein